MLRKKLKTYLVVGLGNPGLKYENTRHNVGFQCLDQIACFFSFPELKVKFNAELTQSLINQERVVLIKPLTYMNLSGQAVRQACLFWKTKDLIVIHDDVDLTLGKIKISWTKNSGGHKGVESIIKETGIKKLVRIRIGVSPEKKPKNTEKFVLTKFNAKEKEIINQSLEKAVQLVELIIKQGPAKTSSVFGKEKKPKD